MGQARARARRLVASRRRAGVVAGVAALALAGGVTTAVVASSDPAPTTVGEAAAFDVDPGPVRAQGLSAETRARLAKILGEKPPEPEAEPAATTPSVPVRLEIPSIGVDAGVVPVTAPDRALLPPSDPDLLGWWSEGAEPGAAQGSALITGHSVHTGGGALQDLADVDQGDEVVVETEAGAVRYAVTRTAVLDKPALAREAPGLFSQEAQGRVVLITCADWNGAEWLSNTVVTAEPV